MKDTMREREREREETFSALVTKLCQEESGKTTNTRYLTDYDITPNTSYIYIWCMTENKTKYIFKNYCFLLCENSRYKI